MLTPELIAKAKAASHNFTPTLLEVEAAYLTAAGHTTYPGCRKDMFDRAMEAHERETIRKIIEQIDNTPAILWVGKGGIKERLTALLEGRDHE